MKRLQRFDSKLSHYERPNQAWVCGRKDVCDVCPLGPDERGNCRATTECSPRLEGSRWHCTRGDARGGKCADGPLPDGTCCRSIPPCSPKRSVRSRRGVAVALAVAATIGAVLFTLAGQSRDMILSPGPLISQHTSGDITCAKCHTAAEIRLRDWAKNAFTKAGAHADTLLCLNCHQFGKTPMQPHSLSPTELAGLTTQIKAHVANPVRAAGLFSSHPAEDAEGGLDCATCHREHHGREADLKKIADASCQTCHVAQFASFKQGHPDFISFPYSRRTRIQFDHAGHHANYIKDKFDCNDCHTTDTNNRQMLTKPFEEACSKCHLDGITKPGEPGIAVLDIPGLDPKFAKAHGIGQWPADADGEITPIMRYLLSQDPKTAKALATLKGTDLTSLTNAKPEIADAAEQLAWSIKELFADLITSGQDTLKKRLGPVSAAAFGELPPESVRAFTQADWWPALLSEVAAHRAGQPLPTAAPVSAPVSAASVSSASPAVAASAAKPAAAGDDDLLGPPTPAPAAPKPAAAPAKPASNDDLLGGDDLLGSPTPAVVAKPPASKVPEPVTPEKWVSTGGWHLTPADYTLRYRPTGHADAFFKAWLDLGADRAVDPDGLTDFNQLSREMTCTKCHSVDRVEAVESAVAAPAALKVNWPAVEVRPHEHTVAKFSHGTHFIVVGASGCVTCHQLNPGIDYNAKFKDNFDPQNFISSFKPLNVATCANCHNEKAVGNSCLLCHNYHYGEFAPAKVSGLVQVAPPETKPAAKP
jgi:hypothetical protein